MIDHIEIKKKLTKQEKFNPYLLTKVDIQYFGAQFYKLNGEKPITITFNSELNEVFIKGSIPYFWSGHNYTQSREVFAQAIEHISKKINVDLWDAEVLKFEYGKTICIDHVSDTVINNHVAIGSKLTDNKGKCKIFKSKGEGLKIYDAVYNFKHKVPVKLRIGELQYAGMKVGQNYVRIEKLYTNPEYLFGADLTLADLLTKKINNKCRRDLYQTYRRIRINTGIKIPDKKSQINTTCLAMIALLQTISQSNMNIDAKTLLWSIIKNCQPLNKHDKKARKQELTKAINKCLSDERLYDLSTILIRKLAADRY